MQKSECKWARKLILSCFFLLLPFSGNSVENLVPDPSSSSNFQKIMMKHLDLSLTIDFDNQVIKGKAAITLPQDHSSSVLILLAFC